MVMNDNAETARAWEQFLRMHAAALERFGPSAPLAGGEAATALVESALRALARDPARIAKIQETFLARQLALWQGILEGNPPAPDARATAPSGADTRVGDPAWHDLPFFRLLRDQHRLLVEWAEALVDAVEAPAPERRRIAFVLRQWAEAAAPANFLPLNPTALRAAFSTGGESLRRGMQHLEADLRRGRMTLTDETAFEVGRNLAVTPGAVVHENPLVQLIQYGPSTDRVHGRPLLIVPPFINKYYILDLRAQNSFVRFAVSQGLRVFIISWRNVPPALGGASWADYVEDGVLASLRPVLEITRARSVNLLGFCVGGTLSACAAAVEARRGGRRIASLTLLATLLDFADPGEIAVFIDEAYVRRCEQQAGDGSVVPGARLEHAFASLRARDLIWHAMQHRYLLGEEPPAFDLLFWNADSADLPSRLYADYLGQMYSRNALRVPDALQIHDTPVDLGRIRVPAYVLAARDDHIVPWRSAYAGMGLLAGERRFVLAESGHVAGIVNPPAPPRRGYWLHEDVAMDADAWYAAAQHRRGSWWQDWARWLRARSGRLIRAPAGLGSETHPPLEPAPGRYVREASGAATENTT